MRAVLKPDSLNEVKYVRLETSHALITACDGALDLRLRRPFEGDPMKMTVSMGRALAQTSLVEESSTPPFL